MKGIENGHHWLYDRKPEHKDCQFKQLFHSPDTLPEVYWYVHQTSILPLFHQIPLETHLIGWLFFWFPLAQPKQTIAKRKGTQGSCENPVLSPEGLVHPQIEMGRRKSPKLPASHTAAGNEYNEPSAFFRVQLSDLF